MFYSIERTCGGVSDEHSHSSCDAREVVPWTTIDVRHDTDYQLQGFDYDFPVKLTIVDAGFRSEKVG